MKRHLKKGAKQQKAAAHERRRFPYDEHLRSECPLAFVRGTRTQSVIDNQPRALGAFDLEDGFDLNGGTRGQGRKPQGAPRVVAVALLAI